ncbi:MAG: hypothetical protein R3D58_17080 [Saprospiraceae bacterium]
MANLDHLQEVSNRPNEGELHQVDIPDPIRLSERPNEQASDNAPTNSPHLDKILETQKALKAAKSKTVIFSPPILTQNGNAFIYPFTINIIQGQNGVHKSRFAEMTCSALLKRPTCEHDLVGLAADLDQSYTVVVVDSERNLKEQLPYALQNIQIKAGYSIADDPPNFDFITLLNITRAERFDALKQYLGYVRQRFQNHIFIVLDVTTDCVLDWNRPDQSLELIDEMNQAINEFDVTFLCLIHENPGQQKARGHLGTEIMNKASTAVQIGFEKDSAGNDTDLIRVKYLKCRNTKRLEPFHLKYCDQFKGLVLASADEVATLGEQRKEKALVADVAERLEQYLADEPIKSAELVELLMKDFEASDRTIKERIKEIERSENTFHNSKGQLCKLARTKPGREVIYHLEPLTPF